MITANGVFDLVMEQYRGQPCDALSMSASDAIVLAQQSPAHLRAAWEETPERENRVDLGVAIHALALEPARATSAIRIIEADNFMTKVAKEAAAEAFASRQTPLLRKDYERAGRAVEALRAHPVAGPLLKGKVEQSWFAKDAATGLWFKARPDLFTPDEIIVDLKTCASAHPEFVKRRIFEGGWYQQAPWHCDVVTRVLGREPKDYLWIVIEQKAPHAIIVRRPNATVFDSGARKNAAARQTFARCAKSGQWPAWPATIEEIGLPDYAHYRLEEEALAAPGMEAARLGLELNANPFG